MKKKLIFWFSIITGVLLQAQNIEKTSFTEKNIIREAFGFSNPVCNKDVLIDVWRNYIQEQGGKIKGGIVSKVIGTDIEFSPFGKSWNGYFAYSFETDNTMSVFTSFQDMDGDFITSDRFADEAEAAKKSLLRFQLDVQKACNQDDLNNAIKYSNSLSKEKIRNSDRVMFLEKSIKSDTQKIEIKNGMELTKKEQLNITKMKQRMVSNEAEIKTLQERNSAIDEELKAQSLVILGFQEKQEELNIKNIDSDLSEEIHEDNNIVTINKEENWEEIPVQKERTKKFFDK